MEKSNKESGEKPKNRNQLLIILLLAGFILGTYGGITLVKESFEQPGNDVWLRNINSLNVDYHHSVIATTYSEEIIDATTQILLTTADGMTISQMVAKVEFIVNYNSSLPSNYHINCKYEIWRSINSPTAIQIAGNFIDTDIQKWERITIPIEWIDNNDEDEIITYTVKLLEVTITINDQKFYLQHAQIIVLTIVNSASSYISGTSKLTSHVSTEYVSERDLMCNYIPSINDNDADGVSNENETYLGTDPDDPDTDNDGLSDNEEPDLGTSPTEADTDGDGVSDYLEINVFHTDPLDPNNMSTDLPSPKKPNYLLWILLAAIPIIGVGFILIRRNR